MIISLRQNISYCSNKKKKFEKLLSNFQKKPKCDDIRMKKLEPRPQAGINGLGNKKFGLIRMKILKESGPKR